MKIVLLLVVLAAVAESRRIRVRPVSSLDSNDDAPQQVEYYAEQEEEHGPVLVSRQDNYGRATGQPRNQPKLKPIAAKVPPAQTIRNFNKVNDDGSFTFGYQADDGSFKEETRGVDCVVRGKYGYIDPDGNKREFSYVSGNPCDPNAIEEEEEELPSREENVPNIPIRRPIKTKGRPAQAVFQQNYNRDDEEEEENIPRNIPTARPTPTFRPSPTPTFRASPTPTFRASQTIRPAPTTPRNFPIPTFAQLEQDVQPQILRATPKPKLLASQPRATAVSITPRPTQPPATTYRPQSVVHVTSQSPKRPLNLDEELKNFQLQNNAVSTPRTVGKPSGNPIYTSELVFDPSSGHYNTVLYQQLPQNQGDFSLRGRLQPHVQNPQPYYQPRPYIPRPQPQPQPSFNHNQQQQLFQQQQSALLQQSNQLYAAQQKKQQEPQRFPSSLLQQEPQRFGPPEPQRFGPPEPQRFGPPEPQRFGPPPKSYSSGQSQQPFYYVAPSGDRQSLSNGQIDAFLRGHSIAI